MSSRRSLMCVAVILSLCGAPNVARAQIDSDFLLSISAGAYAFPFDDGLVGGELGLRAWAFDYMIVDVTVAPIVEIDRFDPHLFASLVVGARFPAVFESAHAFVVGGGVTLVPSEQESYLFAGRLGYEFIGEQVDFRVWAWVPALIPVRTCRYGGFRDDCSTEFDVFPFLGISASIGFALI